MPGDNVEVAIRQSALTGCIDGCPMRVQYSYGLGVNKYETPTNHALFVGSQVHQAVELAYQHWITNGSPMDRGDIVDALVDNWHHRTVASSEDPVTDINWGNEKTEGDHLADAIAIIQAWYQHYRANEARAVELPLSRTWGPVTVTSRIDVELLDGTISETKTVRTFFDKRLNRERQMVYTDTTVLTKPQPRIHLALLRSLRSYRYLLLGKGKEDTLVQTVNVPLTAESVKHWIDMTLLPALEDVAGGRFPARPGAWCGYCDLRGSVCKVMP